MFKKNKLNISLFIILLGVGLAVLGNVYRTTLFRQKILNGRNNLKALFFNVFQGDAAMLISPDGIVTLIDGGTGNNEHKRFDAGKNVLVPFLEKWKIKKIDNIILSHPDQDHLGGLIRVLQNVKVERVLDSDKYSNSMTYYQYKKIIKQKNIKRELLKRGDVLSLGKNLYCQVLSPPKKNNSYDDNNNSLVLRVSFGETDILFTGDIEFPVEQELANKYKKQLQSEILKVSHHGSESSSSLKFLKTVDADCYIISVGSKNDFNMPSGLVLDRIKVLQGNVYRTDVLGHIMLLSNGLEWMIVSQNNK